MVAVEDVFVLLRALKGPELACLVAILMSPEPARMSWLRSVTGLSDHTVSDALTILSSLGLAQDDGRRSHWVPAGGFCEAFLKRAEEGLDVGEHPALSPLEPSFEQKGESERPEMVDQVEGDANSTVGAGERSSLSPANRGTAIRRPAMRGNGPDRKQKGAAGKKRRGKRRNGRPAAGESGAENLGTPNTDTAVSDPANKEPANRAPANRGPAIRAPAIRGSPESALSLKEEVVKLIDQSSSGLKAQAAQNSPPETDSPAAGIPGAQDGGSQKARTRRVLAATQLLFGEMVLGPPERYPDLSLLLGCIAEAYSQRQHLRNPARVVYANLAKGALPAQGFLRDPLAHLPDRFLIAAGLASPIEGASEADLSPADSGWEDSVAALAQEEAPACQGDASLDLPANGGAAQPGGRSACQAWKAVRAALLGEMPLSTYQRYIEPLELVSFESEVCAFTLQAQDEFSRQWLEDRMGRMLEHLLSGICNRLARVILIV